MSAMPATISSDPNDLLELATRAAKAAGAELLRRYGHIEGLETKSSATDPVSDADRASERMLVEMILAQRPDDGIIGEEGTARPGASGYTWVIDPLDGTVNYLYQLDNFSVSIAVEVSSDGENPTGSGDPVIAVVHDPVRDRTFTAARGGGAFLGDRKSVV